tara:strand:- start:5326 stop:6084 length:759 start_codon:yes stop_codon:yes gene_type:complete
MVDVFGYVQRFYEAPELELLSDPSSFSFVPGSGSSGYFDLGFESEPSSFMNLGDTALGYDPYRAEQLAEQRFAEEDDFGYNIPITGYRGGDPRAFAEEGEVLSRDEFFRARGAPDDRSYLKMLKDFLGIDELIGEENLEMVTAFGRAAGLLGKERDVGLGRTKYKAKSKTPSMKQGAKMTASRKSISSMAGKSRTAPSGDEYFRRQNISEMGNRVADLSDSSAGTGTGPRGKNIRDPSLSDIRTRKYVMATA